MSESGANRVRKERLQERSRFLRGCVPGDELHLECSDNRSRDLTVEHRIELQNGMVMLKLSGHGARYQLNVPHENYEAPVAPLIWRIGNATVTDVALTKESDEIWSDTTAADLGVPKR